jgi:hypothetical protein
MTDSPNVHLRDTRPGPARDEAPRLTFSNNTAPEAARQGLPPHPFISARRLRQEFGLATPYSEGKRLGYGLLWTGWTLLLGIAGVSLLPHGSTVLSGLIAFALAIITGRYAYRIWTWQAKRLIFFIIW